MTDIEGDQSKRPPECNTAQRPTSCPHIKCTYEGYDGERWNCNTCGQSFYLDYDEMR
jgi:uncharacterized protein with PIN domain